MRLKFAARGGYYTIKALLLADNPLSNPRLGGEILAASLPSYPARR